MATRSMGSTDALQIKNSGTDGKFASRLHTMGRWISTQLEITGSTTTIVQSSVTVTYNKRGFFPSTGQYEYWLTTNRDSSAPSGNSLIDITVVGEIRS